MAKTIANYFNIEPDDLIFCVRHQITLDSVPLAIEDIYVPKDVLPKLEVVNSSVFTIKDIFAFYGIEISSMQQTMEIIDGTSKIKKLLDIPNGVALIMLSCDYWDNNGRAIAYSRSFIRSDRTSFTIQLHE